VNEGTPPRDIPPHRLPVEDSLDLHAFSPRDVTSAVDEYLNEAASKGYREVRLIHGKGIGFQRAAVRAVLARHPLVVSYTDAAPGSGGWGATRVILRPDR
jgi:dsDNA-specific endonuclease/ATPase MutS2